MFKKIFITTILVAVVGLLIYGAVNRSLTGSEGNSLTGQNGRHGNTIEIASVAEIEETGSGQGYRGGGAERESGSELEILPPADPTGVSQAEIDALLYMREEEKLARDVYAVLYTQWQMPVFLNISQSEENHTLAIKTLLDRYNLQDPAQEAPGVFTNPDLQALYDSLVERGSRSLADALLVGAEIEEVDILDLQERLAQVDNADILQTFDNLLHGSYSHLRSFASTYTVQTGLTYTPQHLDAQAYQTILSEQTGNGGRGGYGRRGNG